MSGQAYFVWKDILQFHSCKIHNNRRAVVLELFCIARIDKNADTRQPALFLLSDAGIPDR
jgi:hypothetical protein